MDFPDCQPRKPWCKVWLELSGSWVLLRLDDQWSGPADPVRAGVPHALFVH
jgi:hypothetical protein